MKQTLTAYAKEMVTANGKPSGTATTNTVIPVIKYRMIRFQYRLLQDSCLKNR